MLLADALAIVLVVRKVVGLAVISGGCWVRVSGVGVLSDRGAGGIDASLSGLCPDRGRPR
jgi:hypothetical protein